MLLLNLILSFTFFSDMFFPGNLLESLGLFLASLDLTAGFHALNHGSGLFAVCFGLGLQFEPVEIVLFFLILHSIFVRLLLVQLFLLR